MFAGLAPAAFQQGWRPARVPNSPLADFFLFRFSIQALFKSFQVAHFTFPSRGATLALFAGPWGEGWGGGIPRGVLRREFNEALYDFESRQRLGVHMNGVQ